MWAERAFPTPSSGVSAVADKAVQKTFPLSGLLVTSSHHWLQTMLNPGRSFKSAWGLLHDCSPSKALLPGSFWKFILVFSCLFFILFCLFEKFSIPCFTLVTKGCISQRGNNYIPRGGHWSLSTSQRCGKESWALNTVPSVPGSARWLVRCWARDLTHSHHDLPWRFFSRL